MKLQTQLNQGCTLMVPKLYEIQDGCQPLQKKINLMGTMRKILIKQNCYLKPLNHLTANKSTKCLFFESFGDP